MLLRLRAIAVAVLCLTLSVLFAQNPVATLVGTVFDSSDAVVAGASLAIRNTDSGETRKAISDEKGEFTIPDLAPGPYEVVISKDGFRAVRQTNLVLQMDQVARMDFRLQLGVVSQTVEVTAAVPLVNADNGSKGQVFALNEVLELPLDSHSFSNLALLVPGVSPNAPVAVGPGYTINGARADNTNFVVDGFNNRDAQQGYPQVSPHVEAMQEFKMQTSGYSAEYGRFAGGVMNMVVKSGANQVHGSLFEFLRNDLLDTRSFFDASKSELRRNEFGGTFSGPVWIPKLYSGKDRTFFMFSWESARQVSGTSKLGIVPTAAEHVGDFSAVAPIGDPLSTGSCPGSGQTAKGACFPGNRIPASRLSSQALAAQAYYPLPNMPSQVNNYLSYAAAPTFTDSPILKIDDRVSSRDSLSFRYIKGYERATFPFNGSPNMGLFPDIRHDTHLLTGLTYTRVFSPALVNEARIGFSRSWDSENSAYHGTDYDALFGIPGTTTDPKYVAFPFFNITGLNPWATPWRCPRFSS